MQPPSRQLYTGPSELVQMYAAMSINTELRASSVSVSAWVRRFLPLIKRGGRVLDLAAGSGRHTRLLLDSGFTVCAVDRDISALLPLARTGCEVREIDLETGAAWSLGAGCDGIVVTKYLHRPLLPAIAQALAAGGVLIYETFARGHERFGRPHNPDFLLHPGELLDAFAMLTVVAFEQGEISMPRHAVIQRIAAVAGPMGHLPAGLDMGQSQE
jgi:SAM-dependent methyltransferase